MDDNLFTWNWLSMNGRDLLRDLVLGNGAVLFATHLVKQARNLEELGLVEMYQDEQTKQWVADPTELGKQVYKSSKAPAQPATGGGADAARTDLDADTLTNWPRMFRERATDPMFAGLYNEAGKNDILDLLDVVATLRTQLADANARAAAAEAALEPFAEAWLRVPLGLKSVLRIWNGREGDESGYDSLGISTDDLQDAHTAFFNLEPTPKKEG